MTLTVEPPPVEALDAGVIEDARARQRLHRWIIASIAGLVLAGVGVGLAIGSGGGGHSVPPTRSGVGSSGSAASRAQESQKAREIARVGTADPIGAARLFAGGTGWAMNGIGLYLTHDFGAHWRAITPPRAGDVIANVVDVAYLDARRFWLSQGDVAGKFVGSPRGMTIDRTTDGGRIWRLVSPSGCSECGGGAYLSLLSAEHGFMLSAGALPARLLATTNGGASWTLVATAPFTGRITFTSPHTAWAVSDPSRWSGPTQSTPVGGGVLYRSANGGRVWHRVHLTPPRGYGRMAVTAGVPVFFGPREGVVPVRYRNTATGTQRLIVYTTTDGGRSWSAHPAPTVADLRADQWGIADAIAFTAPNPDRWLFFAGHVLYVTHDAGRSWSTVSSQVTPTNIGSISFTSLTTGWAIFPVAQGVALVRTTDGGKHWTALAPH